MKILFCIPQLHSKGGGAERALTQIASKLVEKNNEVIILSLDDPEENSFYEISPNIKRIFLFKKNRLKYYNFLENIKLIFSIRKKIFILKPKIVISFLPPMYVINILALINLNIPHIGCEHLVFRHYLTSPLKSLLNFELVIVIPTQ